ncbi:MAG: DUF2442 domain-containing protein, partial [Pirellulales bacterium]|nr:DUF2442 domain-containing protein [Pirellulales bacterium]
MGILAQSADERVRAVRSDVDTLSVDLMDGRTITVPLAWYPRLLNATQQQRDRWQPSGGGYGIHWPEINEDLSTEGLLRGAPAPKSQTTKD